MLATSCGERRDAVAKRVIIITCDTLRADRLGIYGYDRPTSTRLDAFAADATVYEHAYSCAPVTAPALSSMMTGRIPDAIGVSGGNRKFMPSEVETLAEVASEAGMTTGAIVSNWVLRAPPDGRRDIGLIQGFDSFDDEMTERELNRANFDRLAPDTTDAALAWLQERRDEGDDSFFLWVHYQDPHGPYTPPDEWDRRFASRAEDTRTLPVNTSVKGRHGIPSYQALDGERRSHVYENKYDAEIAFFDEHVGRLLDELAQSGLYDETLILFTADHGESMGEHDYWFCHGENVYRESVRVPLIVRFPRQAGARRVTRITSHLDVFPTVTEALGLSSRVGAGASLFEATPTRPRFAPHSLGRAGSAKRWYGVSNERWRLVVKEGSAPQLFDIANDAGETHDLASEHPDHVETLLNVWKDFAADAKNADAGHERVMSKEDLEAFRKLGYVGDER